MLIEYFKYALASIPYHKATGACCINPGGTAFHSEPSCIIVNQRSGDSSYDSVSHPRHHPPLNSWLLPQGNDLGYHHVVIDKTDQDLYFSAVVGRTGSSPKAKTTFARTKEPKSCKQYEPKSCSMSSNQRSEDRDSKNDFVLRSLDSETFGWSGSFGIEIQEFKSSAKGKGLAFDLILAPPALPKLRQHNNNHRATKDAHNQLSQGKGNGTSLINVNVGKDINGGFQLSSTPHQCNFPLSVQQSYINLQNSGSGLMNKSMNKRYHRLTFGTPKTTPEVISIKLRRAEEKRKFFEMQMREQWKEKEDRIRQIEFMSKEATEIARAKFSEAMRIKEERRYYQIRAVQNKLKNHQRHVNEVCQTNERFIIMVKERMEKKFKNIEDKKATIIQITLEKLREHELKIEEVKKQNEEMRLEMDIKMKAKMNAAIANRKEQLEAIRMKIKEHVNHVDQIKMSHQLNKLNGFQHLILAN